MNSQQHILELIYNSDGVSVNQLSEVLNLSRQRIHRILKQLLAEEKVIKIGSAPKVLYKKNNSTQSSHEQITASSPVIESNWMLIDHIGRMHKGMNAFRIWCENRKLPVAKTIVEYELTLKKYEAFRDQSDLIDGLQKLKNTKGLDVCLSGQYYHDFYAIERFGKTKLGQLIHFGKMTQSKKLIKEIIELTKNRLINLITSLNVDAVGYIPPTLNREVQIMKELEKGYNLTLPIIRLQKIKGEIVVPQKALNKLKDRIANAQYSIYVKEKRQFQNVLLIDDALGSGATINETACKLISAKIATKVYGYAVTGSYKGFEVISEA